MKQIVSFLILLNILNSCSLKEETSVFPWEEHGKLLVKKDSKIIQHLDGTPFLWLGCTAWGMTEWLTREEVDLYLDDRKSKGMNVAQLCLIWGKRTDNPMKFEGNARNQYGHKAFVEANGFPDATQPDVVEGGFGIKPNDYWDHVDYCLEAIKKRGMVAAVLPFWGRRYVNGTHDGHSLKIFTLENIFQYGEFLGRRYGSEPNIIWVNGGDVKASSGGDFVPYYRLLAEGLAKGISGQSVKWNEKSDVWDSTFMTYHPDGTAMINSSEWFHNDVWLDFNMIETHSHRDFIAASIRQDLVKKPLKPTVLGEGHYEGRTNKNVAKPIHIRRQAYQTFFAGAAGHTYGGGFDEQGNGPLFSPSNNWKHLLEWEGAGQMIHLRKFLKEYEWWKWKSSSGLITEGKGKGELEKLAVRLGDSVIIYFPENSSCEVIGKTPNKITWFNTKIGDFSKGKKNDNNEFVLPQEWEDGILILK